MSRALHAAERLAAIPADHVRADEAGVHASRCWSASTPRASLNDEALAAWQNPAVQARIRAYVEQTVGKK